MASFGIRPGQALGVSIPTLRKMAKDAFKELQAKEIKD